MRACDRVRDRGSIVVVGDVGVELARTPFYLKEIDLRFARSYGPGRYERTYEEYAVDYPDRAREVDRRTQHRGIPGPGRPRQAAGRRPGDAHVRDRRCGARLRHDRRRRPARWPCSSATSRHWSGAMPSFSAPRVPGSCPPGIVGAGNYAKMTFLPAMKAAGFGRLVAVTSSGGLSARHLAERHGVAEVSPERRVNARQERGRHRLRPESPRLPRRHHRAGSQGWQARLRREAPRLERRRAGPGACRPRVSLDAALARLQSTPQRVRDASQGSPRGPERPPGPQLPRQRGTAPGDPLVQGSPPGWTPPWRGVPLHRPRFVDRWSPCREDLCGRFGPSARRPSKKTSR